MIDLHIHLLPGLDDGAADVDEAVDMCRMCVEDGVDRVVAVGHMFDGMFDIERSELLAGVQRLRTAVDTAGIDIDIHAAGDTHLDPNLGQYADAQQVVTVGDDGRYLLVEFPRDVIPPGTSEVLFQLQTSGITPVITHPERNREVQDNPGWLAEQVGKGVLVQITAASLTGVFGSTARECACEMVERRIAHVVASDAHSTGRRRPGLTEARKVAASLLDEDHAALMFEEIPRRIVAGENVTPPAPRETTRRNSWWGL